MLILDLWGISFHPAEVVGLGNDLLFNSILGHCVGMPKGRATKPLFDCLLPIYQNNNWTIKLHSGLEYHNHVQVLLRNFIYF